MFSSLEENPKIVQKTAVLPAQGRKMKVQAPAG